MKKLFLTSVIALGMCAISATPAKESKVQCGVSEDIIRSYLQDGPHHHTTTWFQDLRGSCNSNVGIENNGTATVYVDNGIIVGHSDVNARND